MADQINTHKTELPRIERSEAIKTTLLIFLPFLFLLVVVMMIVYALYAKTGQDTIEEHEKFTVNLQKKYMSNAIINIAADLMFFANSSHLDDLFEQSGQQNMVAKDILSREFLLFSRASKLFDQIRLIDDSGMELIRVNFNNGTPAIVPTDKLQNKKNRYYFADTFNLDEGEVFVSPLDLNIEHGEIEKPLKPMIRFGTVFVDQKGKKRGVVIMNYLAETLLETFSELGEARQSNSMLINNDGYFLKALTPKDEWGFMFKDRQGITFINQFPEAWPTVHGSESGQLVTPNGLFTFTTITPLQEGQKSSTGSGEAYAPSQSMLNTKEYSWKAISYVPTAALHAEKYTLRRWITVILCLVGVVLFIGSWRLSISQLSRRHAEKALKESYADLEKRVVERTAELKNYQDNLQTLVEERTAELARTNEELNRFNQLFVGRELRINELKKELNVLKAECPPEETS